MLEPPVEGVLGVEGVRDVEELPAEGVLGVEGVRGVEDSMLRTLAMEEFVGVLFTGPEVAEEASSDLPMSESSFEVSKVSTLDGPCQARMPGAPHGADPPRLGADTLAGTNLSLSSNPVEGVRVARMEGGFLALSVCTQVQPNSEIRLEAESLVCSRPCSSPGARLFSAA